MKKLNNATAAAVGLVVTVAVLVQLIQPRRSGVATIEIAVVVIVGAIVLIGLLAGIYIIRGKIIQIKIIWIAPLAILPSIFVALILWSQSPESSPVIPVSSPSPASSIEVPLALQPAKDELYSSQLENRLSAIANLQQLMQASSTNQPFVVQILCEYISKESPVMPTYTPITSDIQAALTTLGKRNPANDGKSRIVLNDVNLADANLVNGNFSRAIISGNSGSDLSDSDLADANFSNADLTNSYFGSANISETDFTGATLLGASFNNTPMCSGGTPINSSRGYICTQ